MGSLYGSVYCIIGRDMVLGRRRTEYPLRRYWGWVCVGRLVGGMMILPCWDVFLDDCGMIMM